jgi:hypothetical protein
MTRPLTTVLLGLALLAGCAAEDVQPPPDVPVQVDPRGLTTGDQPCNLLTSTVALHASYDTLDLDHGAVIFWVFTEESVFYNDGDFPASGDLAFRGFNIHRIGFPQEYQLCMPPGRYVIRAVQDTNHNGSVCELGELWGTRTVTHPLASPEDGRIVLDRRVDEADGCPVEQTGLPTSGG